MGNYHWITSPGPHNAETYLEHVARKVGGYVSRTRPAGPFQAQLDLALAPQWGNQILVTDEGLINQWKSPK
ncbi:hypothetical protein FYJ43_02160 [Cutibacterium sp. WCA-380-WT-3A]|uniref:Uncharacterized protein n=1 Tax=Cutibacterium porci TaxID=2605781 RepID=A0A7K0J4V7_9ACTN|nr:hypothetical protein [Cutibacterium porci]